MHVYTPIPTNTHVHHSVPHCPLRCTFGELQILSKTHFESLPPPHPHPLPSSHLPPPSLPPPSPHPIPLSPSICFFPKWTTHIQKLGYFIIVLVSLRKLQNGLGFTCRSQEAGSEESSTVGVWNFSDPSTKVNCNCVKSVVLLCLMSFPASPTFCPSPWIRG